MIDTTRPVSVAIHVERDIVYPATGGQSRQQSKRNRTKSKWSNNDNNEFTKQFFTTFKPDITGKYTITVYNLGNSPVSIGVLLVTFHL